MELLNVITDDRLVAKRSALAEQFKAKEAQVADLKRNYEQLLQQFTADLNAISGGIQVLDQLLAESAQTAVPLPASEPQLLTEEPVPAIEA
jgi:hypothetical protein